MSSKRQSMNGFGRANIALIAAMISDGWTGRVTANRHWFGTSPDGTTTVTIPSKDERNRSLANAEAIYKKWKKGTP